MKRHEVHALIEEIGIVPVVRAASPQEARFAAEAVWQGGIPIVEITMTVPGALDVISDLVKTMPKLLVGAGTVVNQDLALQCFDAGAQFLEARDPGSRPCLLRQEVLASSSPDRK